MSKEIIERRALRTGDGTYSKPTSGEAKSDWKMEHNHQHAKNNFLWGWDDEDMNKDDQNSALIIN